MLELDDIQHILLTRTPALTGQYEFVSFRDAAAGRAWVAALLDKVQSAAEVETTVASSKRWVTLAFTWNGLRALGVDEDSLATFPEEFKQGMVARAEMLGDTGVNHPDNWVGGLASPNLHAIAILFARDARGAGALPFGTPEAPREDAQGSSCSRRSIWRRHRPSTTRTTTSGGATGCRSRSSKEVATCPRPVPARRSRPASSSWAIPTRTDPSSSSRSPRSSRATGASWPTAGCRSTWARFAISSRSTARPPEEQELVAAKLMGRWRSGAPLVLAPEKDDPALGADMQRNNDFNYKEMDPHGYAMPLGSHCRRMNPRDTAHNMNRRRMIRRGATYGPPLPEGAPEDGVERGIAAFVICASLIRQFEFAQNVWINDKNFHELGNERDPIIGTQDGTLEFKIPKRPIKKRITGLPAFTTVRGGAYFFQPGLKALQYLAALDGGRARA